MQAAPRGRPKRVTCETERDVGTDYFWKGDDRLIYQAGSSLCRVDLISGKVRDITPVKNASFSILHDLADISSDEILIELARSQSGITDVYRLNISSRRREMVKVAKHPVRKKFGVVQRWIVDNAGCVCAALSTKGTNDYLLIRPNEKARFGIGRIMDFRRSVNFDSICYAKGDRAICVLSSTRRNRDTAAVALISATTGRELQCLYHNQDADVETFGFSKKRKVITYATFHDWKQQQKALDYKTEAIFKTLRKELPGYVFDINAWDGAEKKFIVIASSDRVAGKCYLLDISERRSHRLSPLGEMAPWLKHKDLARVSPVKFRSRDGLTIHGYLTLPPGRAPKKLPLVVNVHGGPETRDFWEYTFREGAEVQFLANRGYAVLQVNFRGSMGYGRSFWMKGFRQRGRKMQDDITDGVQWLIKRGIADRERIAIYGKSYGGYAALAGITFTPELYKAAIAYASVSNWLTWLKKFSPENRPVLPQFYVKVGDPQKDRKRLEAVAPALHAGRVTKPVFIAHGALDTTAPKSEADQMVAALDGADVEYMVKANEGHIFQNEKNKIDFYRAMETFLAKHVR